MTNILVSGASGIVGYGILKSLRQTEEEYHLIGTSIYEDSVAPAFCDIFELAPTTADDKYTEWLCSIIKKHDIKIVIPSIEIDVQKWSTRRNQISDCGAVAVLNDASLIDMCADKWLFYEKLSSSGSELAIDTRLNGDFNSISEKYGLPFLLKPRRSYASKGIVIVDSKAVFDQHKNELGTNLMAQPIIGSEDEEYTVSAFFDKDSQLRAKMSLKRKLSKDGFTEKAWVIKFDQARPAIEELARLFKPVGPTNFQFRLKNDQLKLLEINPRISSSTSIRSAFGYNESVMAVEFFLNDRIPVQPKIKKGHAIRYTEDAIFYESHNI